MVGRSWVSRCKVALAMLGTLLGMSAMPAYAQNIVVIPGDQAMQTMVAAVQALKREPALAALKFQILPQALAGTKTCRCSKPPTWLSPGT